MSNNLEGLAIELLRDYLDADDQLGYDYEVNNHERFARRNSQRKIIQELWALLSKEGKNYMAIELRDKLRELS